MKRSAYTIDDYMDAIQTGHWFTRQQIEIWVTGKKWERHGRTEKVLAKLGKENRVFTWKPEGMGNKVIYAAKRRTKFHYPDDPELTEFERKRIFEKKLKIPHGLMATECMLRCKLSSPEGTRMIAEHEFRHGTGVIPDWGMVFPSESAIFGEASTRDQVLRAGVIHNKVRAYDGNLEKLRNQNGVNGVRILFVLDVSRDYLERCLRSRWYGLFDHYRSGKETAPYYFVSYSDFLEANPFRLLSEPIYFWGENAKSYPLIMNTSEVIYVSRMF